MFACLLSFQLVLNRADQAKEYADSVVSNGEPVLSDMAFDSKKQHIYLMAGTNVSSLIFFPLENFHDYMKNKSIMFKVNAI